MRKPIPLILLLILSGIAPALQVEAQEPSGAWDNRYSYTLDYLNGTHTSTFSIGPQTFWSGSDWQTLKFEDLGNGYLLENSMITAYIYDWYTVFYDPDNERVCVDDERWIVEVYNEKTKKWREVDLYNPSLSYSNNATHLTVTRSFDTSEGLFNVTYILWQGSRLKHDIVFTSKMEGDNQFRVIMKLTGIYSDKVKHSGGMETITSEKHVVSPFFVFGEDNNNLVFSEYLWKLGEVNEETGEWSPTTLKDVVLDTSAHGSKMDIVIGNYTLAENESLLIDPDSDTWLVGNDVDDMYTYAGGRQETKAFAYLNYANTATILAGFRFTGVSIAHGLTITSSYLSLMGVPFEPLNTAFTMYGEDVDDSTVLEGGTLLDDRTLTSASVGWTTPDLTGDVYASSPDIKTIIQEIVDRALWSSGNALSIITEDTQNSVSCKCFDYSSGAGNAAKLEVTWEAGGGTEYNRFVSQSLSWSGLAYRLCTFNREGTQSLSMASDSYRTWSLSRSLFQGLTLSSAVYRACSFNRLATQGLTMITNTLRNWSLLRTVSQSISTAFYSGKGWAILRTVTQGISASFNTDRMWNTSRTVSQGITTAFNGNGWRLISRLATQSLSFTVNAVGDLCAVITRTVSLSLSLTVNVLSEWTHGIWRLLDIVVKTLSGEPVEDAVISAWQLNGTESFGAITDSEGYIPTQNLTKGNYTILATKEGYLTNNTLLQFLQDKIVEIRLTHVEEGIMISNLIPLMMMSLIPVGLSIQYFRKKELLWAGSAAFMWLIAGVATIQVDPANWVALRVYTLFFVVMLVFTFYTALRWLQESLNPRDTYWDDW